MPTAPANPLTLVKASPAQFRRRLFMPGARGVARFDSLLADFQRQDFEKLDGMLSAVRDGAEPVPRKAFICRTKGASKTSDIAVALLWLALASPRMLRICVAAGDESQALEILRVIRAILVLPQNNWLHRHLKALAGQIVNKATKTTIEILTCDDLGEHGARYDVLVIDELSHAKVWSFVETLLDNSAKSPFGVLLVATNAGSVNSPAFKMFELARHSPDWHFSNLTTPAPWLSQAEIEERRRLSPRLRYLRLWGGQWTQDSDDGLNPDDIAAAVVLKGRHVAAADGMAYVVGVDLGLKIDHSAVVVLAVDFKRQKIQLADLMAWKPAPGRPVNGRAVREHIAHICKKFSPRVVRLDPSEAVVMAQDLRVMTSTLIEEYTFASATNRRDLASAMFSSLSRNGHEETTLELYRDEELIEELHRLEFVDRLTHFEVVATRDHRGHCDRAIALGIALVPAVALLKYGGASEGRATEATSAEIWNNAGRYGIPFASGPGRFSDHSGIPVSRGVHDVTSPGPGSNWN